MKTKPYCVCCAEPIAVQRAALGYRTCLICGEIQSRAVRHTTAPLSKSNYILISDLLTLKQLNPKRIGD